MSALTRPSSEAPPQEVSRPLGWGVRTKVRSALGRTPERPVLVDPVLDHRLRRDGFVKVRVLSEADAHALRDAYGVLHGWEGEGFEVDFWHPDLSYRRAASEAIAEVVDQALSSLFVEHDPFLRNFLAKWPGVRAADSFPEAPHRDWMYTDERRGHLSHVAWIALQDVVGENGQLLVARNSHRVDDKLRGTNIDTEWLGHVDVWAPRMLAVPARAGEAIITHSATVHGSYFNVTDQPRMAVAVAMAPREAGLVHYRRVDDQRAARFDVDPEWFLTQPAPDLLQAPPDLPVAEIVTIGGLELSPQDLSRRLDRSPLARLDRIRAGLAARRQPS